MGNDPRGIGRQRLPERGDMLLQLAHHHVAAVEAEIEEAFGPGAAPSGAAGLIAWVIGGTTGPGAFS